MFHILNITHYSESSFLFLKYVSILIILKIIGGVRGDSMGISMILSIDQNKHKKHQT